MMSGFTRRVTFHVQAGTRVGMGHLSRARGLMTELQNMKINCNLHLDSDAEGAQKAREWGMAPIDMLPEPPSALVIDAVRLNCIRPETMQQYAPRILISPVFNRADMVSHALVRAVSPELRAALPADVTLRTKLDYAFATAHGLCSRALNFEKLEIGLCLSGGADPMELNSVLALLEGLPQVIRVAVIDPRSLTPFETSLQHVSNAENPWDFLTGINLFIGGDGVMLAEAIAQGLPTISLSTPRRKAKNLWLEKSGALRVIARDAKMLREIEHLLKDRAALEEMHSAALKLDGPGRVTRLAQDIRTILEESG